MGLDINFNEEVPVGCPIIPGFAVSFHAQAHAAVDPGRDMNGDFPFHPGVAGATTFLTDLFGYLPLAPALGAGGHPDKLPEGEFVACRIWPLPPHRGQTFWRFVSLPEPCRPRMAPSA